MAIDLRGAEVVIVATHLQPPPGGPPVAQARAVARFADGFRRGRPTVIAGDLNAEPGSEPMRVLADAGYRDGFAGHRPVLTSPADRPAKRSATHS